MVPAWRLPGVLVVAGAVLVWAALIRAQPSDTPASQSIDALLAAKAQRTPAQRKLSSHLLDAWRAVQDQSAVDALVTVDIRADVTPAVLERIQTLGGTVLNSVPKYRAIRARLPLSALEPLATLDAVQLVRPADQAQTHGPSLTD